MTEQQQLSEKYSNLKVKYYMLKRVSENAEKIAETMELYREKHRIASTKNIKLSEDNQRLEKTVKEQAIRLQILEKEVYNDGKECITLTKKSTMGNYVTLKKYEKVKAMANDYTTRCGDLDRRNIELNTKVQMYEKQLKEKV